MAPVVLTRLAPAVPAPVAEGLHDPRQDHVVRHNAAALPHRDVVGRIEAHGGQIAEGAGRPALVSGAQRIAVVLDDEELVLVGQLADLRGREGIAERVRDHDGPSPAGRWPRRSGPPSCCTVASSTSTKTGHQAVLQDRVDGRGEPRGDGDDLVARPQPPLPQLRRGQRRQGQQVGGGAGVGQVRLADAQTARELPLELPGDGARGDPHVQRGRDHRRPVVLVEDRAGGQDRGTAGNERLVGELPVIGPHAVEDVLVPGATHDFHSSHVAVLFEIVTK